MAFEVYVDEYSVTIKDGHGEIVTWNEDEWKESPTEVVTAIANSILICYGDGPDALRAHINHPGERNGFDYRREGDKVVLVKPLTGGDIYGDKATRPNEVLVAAGYEGEVLALHVGYMRVWFWSEAANEEVGVSFDWGDEGSRFVFKERVGYGDEPDKDESDA